MFDYKDLLILNEDMGHVYESSITNNTVKSVI